MARTVNCVKLKKDKITDLTAEEFAADIDFITNNP